MTDQKETSFETSRKIALLALAVLVISQFFPYELEADYQTTIDRGSGIGIVNPGGQAGGHSGWEIHSALWFYLPIMGLFAYLFYNSPRSLTVYWVFLPFFLVTGFGPNIGGIMGIGSILIYGYSIYKKIKEKAKE